MAAEIVLTYIAYPTADELERIRSVAAPGVPTPECLMFSLALIDGSVPCLAFPDIEPGFPRITPDVALEGLHDVVKAVQAEWDLPEGDDYMGSSIKLLERLMIAYPSGEVLVEEFC